MSPEVSRARPAGDEHQVVTVTGGHGGYRRRPCPGCPWKVANTGDFPAEAFAHSAETAHDMATHTFGCHESGTERPVVCAGFLLRGAEHNMAVRLRASSGAIDLQAVEDGGHELHPGYVAMAVANGVPRDDDVLRGCRESSYEAETFTCDCGGRLVILDERDGYRATECARCGAERMEQTW